MPQDTVSVVWERQEPPLLNKWFNCNPELFLTTPPWMSVTYIRWALWRRSSTDAAPVTGSLASFPPLDCLNDSAECASGWLFCGTTCVCFARGEILIWEVELFWTKTMDGAALVEDRAGITFGVELFVSWVI